MFWPFAVRKRIVEIEQGKSRRWRWYARQDSELICQCGPSGFITQIDAYDHFRKWIRGRGWKKVVRYYRR